MPLAVFAESCFSEDPVRNAVGFVLLETLQGAEGEGLKVSHSLLLFVNRPAVAEDLPSPRSDRQRIAVRTIISDTWSYKTVRLGRCLLRRSGIQSVKQEVHHDLSIALSDCAAF